MHVYILSVLNSQQANRDPEDYIINSCRRLKKMLITGNSCVFPSSRITQQQWRGMKPICSEDKSSSQRTTSHTSARLQDGGGRVHGLLHASLLHRHHPSAMLVVFNSSSIMMLLFLVQVRWCIWRNLQDLLASSSSGAAIQIHKLLAELLWGWVHTTHWWFCSCQGKKKLRNRAIFSLI